MFRSAAVRLNPSPQGDQQACAVRYLCAVIIASSTSVQRNQRQDGRLSDVHRHHQTAEFKPQAWHREDDDGVTCLSVLDCKVPSHTQSFLPSTASDHKGKRCRRCGLRPRQTKIVCQCHHCCRCTCCGPCSKCCSACPAGKLRCPHHRIIARHTSSQA